MAEALVRSVRLAVQRRWVHGAGRGARGSASQTRAHPGRAGSRNVAGGARRCCSRDPVVALHSVLGSWGTCQPTLESPGLYAEALERPYHSPLAGGSLALRTSDARGTPSAGSPAPPRGPRGRGRPSARRRAGEQEVPLRRGPASAPLSRGSLSGRAAAGRPGGLRRLPRRLRPAAPLTLTERRTTPVPPASSRRPALLLASPRPPDAARSPAHPLRPST